jgi:hypothetical protein
MNTHLLMKRMVFGRLPDQRKVVLHDISRQICSMPLGALDATTTRQLNESDHANTSRIGSPPRATGKGRPKRSWTVR